MKNYLFTRVITKKEAINKYGKLGYNDHTEAVLIKAENELSAYEQIAPFNYKKHIKFKLYNVYDELENEEDFRYNEIVDLGKVEM